MNPATTSAEDVATLHWSDDAGGHLVLIDQTQLPGEMVLLACHDVETVWEAIRSLRVRGAPAIGIAAAYGVCVGLKPHRAASAAGFREELLRLVDYLASSRPTAVNLFWALDRMKTRGLTELESQTPPDEVWARLLDEARAIEAEDRAMCVAIGQHGQQVLEDGWGVLTHCNAGGLATAAYGTALSVFYHAHQAGKRLHVYADETRPLLQGARLTSWELQRWGIPVTVLCDSMAAVLMQASRVQAVVTGADRSAANGDAATKIGTYGLACLAAFHDVPFYVAAPSSTFDLATPDGAAIPIEQRSPTEVSHGFGRQTVPDGVDVYNPAFDVTPARLIRGLICEHGLIQPVCEDRIRAVLGGASAQA